MGLINVVGLNLQGSGMTGILIQLRKGKYIKSVMGRNSKTYIRTGNQSTTKYFNALALAELTCVAVRKTGPNLSITVSLLVEHPLFIFPPTFATWAHLEVPTDVVLCVTSVFESRAVSLMSGLLELKFLSYVCDTTCA